MNRNFLNIIQVLIHQKLNDRYQTITRKDVLDQLSSINRPSKILEKFREKFSIISEIKFSSPSEGKIADNQNLINIAESYLSNGTAALSILTQQHYFKGSIDYLKQVHTTFPKADLVMKDFVMDPVQVLDGINAGASIILLIVAFLKKSQLRNLCQIIKNSGLQSLIEVHNEKEMNVALEIGGDFIGVNNRNLKTLQVNFDTSRQLSHFTKLFPHRVFISESGIQSRENLIELKQLGYRGALIGSYLMRSINPGHSLAKLMEGICL